MEVRVQQGLGDVSSTLERMSLGDNVKGKQAEIPPLVTDTAKEAAEEDEDVRKGVQESLHNIGLQVGGNIVEQ